MLQARAELEVVVAGLAATAHDEAGVELLRARLTAMHECPEGAFPEADTALHAALAELAGNAVLRDVLRGMRRWSSAAGWSAPVRCGRVRSPMRTMCRSSRRWSGAMSRWPAPRWPPTRRARPDGPLEALEQREDA
ncbi:FCD domain-containing protein [Streptomyces sp. NPDC001663]|uniref:FCD domain-containing protein n=1 Tax=Streptomyces sp. NPDC001663 TaxID=3364597 RepID=UPI0036B2898B